MHRARVRADARAARAARARTPGDRAASRRRRACSGRHARWPDASRRCGASPRQRSFDLALAHGSHELTLAARSLGIPSATAHDYEFATLQHQLGLRAATRVVFPDAIPADRLARLGAQPPKLLRYRGNQGGVLPRGLRAGSGGARRHRPCEGARGRADAARRLALPPAWKPALRGHARAARPRRVRARRRAASHGRAARAIRGLGLPSLHVPERAVDAQSLVALADLTVSAGGTMNREAAALGTPAYTTFTGRRRQSTSS